MSAASASPSAAPPKPKSAGRIALLSGLGLTALGIVGYVAQLSAQRLTTPWYMPALATLGAALIVGSLRRRFTIWRTLSLLLVLLFAGAEWMFVLAMRLPAYAGPVAVGRSFPEFQTMRSDGAPFSQRDLPGDQNWLLVFFRGRW